MLPLLKGNIFGRVLLRTSLPHPVTDLQKDQQTCQKKRGKETKEPLSHMQEEIPSEAQTVNANSINIVITVSRVGIP